MPPTSPFLIGVDLGTTNSAVAAVDTRQRNPRVEVFRVPQLTAPGVVESCSVLPSFLYFPEPDELAAGGLALPGRHIPRRLPVRWREIAGRWRLHARWPRRNRGSPILASIVTRLSFRGAAPTPRCECRPSRRRRST